MTLVRDSVAVSVLKELKLVNLMFTRDHSRKTSMFNLQWTPHEKAVLHHFSMRHRPLVSNVYKSSRLCADGHSLLVYTSLADVSVSEKCGPSADGL